MAGSSRLTPPLTIGFEPNPALVDASVHLTVTGAAPGSPVCLRAETDDDLGRRWAANATFLADDSGAVNPSAQTPVAGSYAGLEPMGLVWSMELAPGEAEVPGGPFFAKSGLSPTKLNLSADSEGRAATMATLTRWFIAPGVTRAEVREDGLIGTLFLPADPGPAPVVVLLGGSDGGLREGSAALLASHGFAAISLAYFGIPPLPPGLVKIPLEYFEAALAWIRRQPAIRGDRPAVLGVSRGAELALLLGATFPQVAAVVAYVPSAYLFGGFDDTASQAPDNRPAWTYRGEPLPFVPDDPAAWDTVMHGPEPIALTPLFLASLGDPATLEPATIPVERINGPVLLLSGEEDAMWPSARFARTIMARLSRHGHPYPDRHVSYPGAGHILQVPWVPSTAVEARHPVDGGRYAFGGNARDSAVAGADAWQQTLGLLHQHLG